MLVLYGTEICSPTYSLGMVWPLPQETLQPDSRSHRRYDKGLSNSDQRQSMHLKFISGWQVATESLSALRTVQAYNALPQEELKFHDKVNQVIELARKEAVASGIFFGTTGWSGNVTLLCLLGYGKTPMHFY